jgi:hypothetical protein
MLSSRQIVTTRFGAFLALVITGGLLGLRFHAEVTAQPSSWTWFGSGFLPTWAVTTINIAFWGLIYWTGVALVFARLRKAEKALLASYTGVIMLIPVRALFPRISGIVHVVQTLLGLMTFIAALVIFLSFGSRDAQHA